MLQALDRAIQKLPNRQKLVFTLRYDQKLSHEEIGKILDRDVGTIKANYHHALRKLQKAVKS
jgi:RNA polymerase sigma factor (sigma-70 family)